MAMSNQSGRPQPAFRLWFPNWPDRSQRQQAPRLPARRPTPQTLAPPPPPPQPPAQVPPTPSQAPQKPPSPSRAAPVSPPPTQSLSPSSRRLPSPSPSPSRRLSQPAKTSPQQPSPSRSPVQSPSPSRAAAQAQPASPGSSQPSQPSRIDSKRRSEAPKGSRSPSPSQATPSRPNSPSPQRETATVDNVPDQPPPSPAIPQPEDQPETTLPQTQNTILSQPVPSLPMQENQPREDVEPKPMSSDILEKQTPGERTSDASKQPTVPESEPGEIRGGKPETKPRMEQQIEPSTLPKFDEKLEQTIEEKPKISSDLEREMKPSKIVSEQVQDNEKPEIKPATQESKKPKESTEEIDTTTAVSHPDRSELITEMRISTRKQSKEDDGDEDKPARNGPKEKESRIPISSIPRSSPCGERTTFQAEIKDGISKLVKKLKVGDPNHQLGNGNGVTIITLAGENRGATMVIGHDAMNNDESFTNNHRGNKLNEEKVRNNSHTADGNSAINTNINSNVQSINNSLLHESSCCETDPGVHWVFSNKPVAAIKIKGKPEQPAMSKTATSNAPAQKLTYNPNVKRRCLRALFLESSDSDQDNPQKPRRHGCRYSCNDKKIARADHDHEGTSAM